MKFHRASICTALLAVLLVPLAAKPATAASKCTYPTITTTSVILCDGTVIPTTTTHTTTNTYTGISKEETKEAVSSALAENNAAQQEAFSSALAENNAAQQQATEQAVGTALANNNAAHRQATEDGYYAAQRRIMEESEVGRYQAPTNVQSYLEVGNSANLDISNVPETVAPLTVPTMDFAFLSAAGGESGRINSLSGEVQGFALLAAGVGFLVGLFGWAATRNGVPLGGRDQNFWISRAGMAIAASLIIGALPELFAWGVDAFGGQTM